MKIEDRYLGDGVYASFDGYQVWLAANHHDEKNIEEMYKLGLAERPKDDDRRPGAPSPAAPASSPGVADSGAAQPKA